MRKFCSSYRLDLGRLRFFLALGVLRIIKMPFLEKGFGRNSIIAFVICFSNLNAAELILKNGDSFIGSVIEETEIKTKFLWKGEEYEIPKSDISSIDKKKKGADASYLYSSLKLKDGSVIVGVVVEESEQLVVIKTNLGFMNIERQKLLEPYSGLEPHPKLDRKYLSYHSKVWNNRFGFSLNVLANHSPISGPNPLSYGGSLFIEPSAFDFSGYRLSFRMDYLQSKAAESNYLFLNQFAYFNKGKIFFDHPKLNFYFNIGLGASITSFSGNGEQRNGVSPSTILGFGWQGIDFRSIQFRIGINSFCTFEKAGTFCATGVELGAMYLL
ncbi:LA_3334 family protein [Leptospira santarosai]|uniref:LA_3334 family protein n=1 Tax=Leptospira santarosai TaxID=28183 RepID=UPI003D15F451